MAESRLYYEAHVNYAHLDDNRRKIVDDLAAKLGNWRQATFEMHKDKVPTGFVTGRNRNLEDIKIETTLMVRWLHERNIQVLRWKIEDTLYDSKHGDELNGLC